MLSWGFLRRLLCGVGRVGQRLIGHVNGFHVPNLGSQCCPWVWRELQELFILLWCCHICGVGRWLQLQPRWLKKLLQSSFGVFSCLYHVGKSWESKWMDLVWNQTCSLQTYTQLGFSWGTGTTHCGFIPTHLWQNVFNSPKMSLWTSVLEMQWKLVQSSWLCGYGAFFLHRIRELYNCLGWKMSLRSLKPLAQHCQGHH